MLDFVLILFSAFVRSKISVIENVSYTDYASGIRLPIARNWPQIGKITMVSQSAQSGEWDKLGITNLARMFLMKPY